MLRNLLNSTRRSRSIGQFAKNRRAHCSERGLRFESLESRTLLDGGGLSGMVYWEADADYIYERGEQPLASFEIELRRHENHLRTQTYLDIGRGQPFDIRGDQYLVGIREPDHPANRTNAAYLYDLESGQILQTFYRPDQGNGSEEAKYRQGDFGRSVLFAGDNVLVDSLEGVYLFDATTGNLLQTFPDLEPVSNHKILRHPLAATADRLLLADPEDNAVELYDLATGELLRTFEHPHPELMATFGRDVAFSGDNILISTGRGHGRYIVDGVDIYADAPEYVPGSVLTYDADTGELLHTFEDPAANEGFSFGAGLDTYGNRVLIGDALDSAAYLFDTTTYDLVQTFRHPDPDGSLGSSVEITSEAVYVSGSGTEGSAAVHVFDIDTGELRKSFEHPRFHETQTPTHADLLFGSQLAADGEYFLAGSSDIIPSIELFTLSPGAPAEGDVRTMTTGQHGSYGFGDLEPGFYTVSVTKIVEGYTLTPPETVGKSTPYSQLPPLPCSDGVYHVAISGETNSYLHGWSHLNFSYTGPEPTPQPTFTPEWPLMPEPGSDRTSEQTFDLLSEDATAASDFAQFGSDEELRQFLLDDALERYDSQFGQPVYSLPPFGPVLVWPHSPQRTISTYDGPNTRVNTVEDGDYLYALVGGELVIFDGLLTEQPQVVSRVTVSGDPLAHFVDGDRLAVVSRVGPEVLVDNDNSHHYTISGRPEQLVTVFDISDREAPRVVQEIAIEGGYVGSRLVDDSLHIVLNDIFYLPSPKLIPTSTTGYNNVSYYETKEVYLQRIEDQVFDLALPNVVVYGPDGEVVRSGLLHEADDIYHPRGDEDSSLMSVVTIDLLGSDHFVTSTTGVPYESRGRHYITDDSLYIVNAERTLPGNNSLIRKIEFDAGEGQAALSASGVVPGVFFNQDAIDEHDGYLRIVTCDGYASQDPRILYVLSCVGQELNIVGSLEYPWIDGNSYATAQLLGDRVFLVNHGEVDRLRVIDLSDPTNPRLGGELEIAEYPKSMHYPIDEDHVIAIGQTSHDAPRVSVFDLSDLDHPRLLDSVTIDVDPERDAHHIYSGLVGYDVETGVLTVPILMRGQREQGDENGRMLWMPPRTETKVFRINIGEADADPAQQAIQPIGQVALDTAVRRSLLVGDLLYSISADTMTANEILHPDVQVAHLAFGVTELGAVDALMLPPTDVASGERWYRFQTAGDGLLTIETTGPGIAGIELYDADGQQIGSPLQQRLDRQVEAGETFSLRLPATDDGSSVALTNLVRFEGSTLIVEGTYSDDHFELDAAASLVMINGVEYSFDNSEVATVRFEGVSGEDTAVLRGTDDDETVELRSKSGTLSNNLPDGYTVSVNNVGSITVDGRGGADEATFYDSRGDDLFVAWPTGATMTRPAGVNKVVGFESIAADATSRGTDVAKLFDSPGDDTLVANPDYASLTGPGFSIEARGFEGLHAYAGAGGIDVAKLYDSPGNDKYVTTPTYGALFGDGFYNRAKFFEGVHAYATAGGVDEAKMFDSPGDDTFYADPTQAALFGDGFYSRAKFFEGTHAYATSGGVDTANLFGSDADDTFYADPIQGALYNSTYYNRAKHFERVFAQAGLGDDDRAELHGSLQDDSLKADATWTQLTDVDFSFLYHVNDFDRVRAIAEGGENSKEVGAVDFLLEFEGQWVAP